MTNPVEPGERTFLFPPPRYSRPNLDKVAGMYIWPNPVTMEFDYYYAKLEKERIGNYVSFVKMPNYLPRGDGFMCFKRKLYKVTLRDFLRRRVNVGVGPYVIPVTSTGAGDTTNSSSNAVSSTPAGVVGRSQASDQPISSDPVRSEEDLAVDLAWQEQIDTLLHHENPEEEWFF